MMNRKINLNELRDKAYKCAVEHGWHEKEYSNEHCLCLVISELMEAVEADRKGDWACVGMKDFFDDDLTAGKNFKDLFELHLKGVVEVELADACISLLDLAGLRNVDLGEVEIEDLKHSEGFFDWTFTECMYSLVSTIADIEYQVNNTIETYLRVMLGEILVFCVQRYIDIFWYIEKKMKYNELRQYKHGGKIY